MMIVNSNDVIGLGLTMSNIYMWPVCNFHSYHIEATTNYVVKTTRILIPWDARWSWTYTIIFFLGSQMVMLVNEKCACSFYMHLLIQQCFSQCQNIKKDFPIKISTLDSPVPLLYWLYPYLAFMYLLYSFSPKVFTNFISFLLQNPDFIFSPFLSFLVSFLHFHRIFFFTCPFHNFSKWFLCTDICICFSYSPWRNIEHNCFLTRNNISMGLAFSLCSRFSKNFVHGCGW